MSKNFLRKLFSYLVNVVFLIQCIFLLLFCRSLSLNERETSAATATPAKLRKHSLFRSMSESHEEPPPVTPVKSPVNKQRPGQSRTTFTTHKGCFCYVTSANPRKKFTPSKLSSSDSLVRYYDINRSPHFCCWRNLPLLIISSRSFTSNL